MDEQETLHPAVKTYIVTHIKDIKTIDNNLRRQYVKRYNEILMMLAYTLQKHGEVSKQALIKHIMKNYILSDVATGRYVKQVLASDVYEYDETLQTFKFPEFLRRELAQQQTQQQPQSPE